MRQVGAIILSLLVLALAGCPKRGFNLASPDGILDGSGATPAPVATPVPRPEIQPTPFTLPLKARAMTLKPVSLPASGETELALEATEAILVLSRTGEVPSTFEYAFEGATAATTGMPRLQSLPQPPGPACGTFEQLLPSKGLVPQNSSFRALRATYDPPKLGARRELYVRSVPVWAVCVAVGTHGAIWIDERDQWRFSSLTLSRLATDFDRLFPGITEQYGAGPSGRSDGYNWGDDRVNVVISQQVPAEYGGYVEPLDFFPDSFTSKEYGMRSNYGKVLYLNAIFGSAHLLNTLVHEYVHIVFYGRRLEVYSRHHSEGLPLGQDSSYFGKVDQSERWLNEGMAVLSEYLFGASPDQTYRTYLQRYLETPTAFDMADFLRQAEADGPNYGGALLFSAFAHARHPGFVREVQLAEGVSTAAVDEVLWRDLQAGFPEVYRDFAVSLLLDGYHPDVPAAYRIPYVDVVGGFGGAAMETAPQGRVPPRSNGVRFIHVTFTEGRGVLRVKDAGTMKAVLLLVTPAAAPEIR